MEGIKKGKIKVEILVKDIEKILNILWLQNIAVSKVIKVNITTLRLEVDYINYGRLCEVVRSVGGKVRVLEGKGLIFLLGKMKKRYSILLWNIKRWLSHMYVIHQHFYIRHLKTERRSYLRVS